MLRNLSNITNSTEQGDLYLRDDNGGVFVAVAAPLNLDEDNRFVLRLVVKCLSLTLRVCFYYSPPIQTDGASASTRGDDSGSGGEVGRGGLLSNVRTALYGSAERQSTEHMGIRRRVFLGFDIHEQVRGL